MTIPEEFDIIVCGGNLSPSLAMEGDVDQRIGGSCGCVVAGRLANLDRNLKVLLIEGGDNNLNDPRVFR